MRKLVPPQIDEEDFLRLAAKERSKDVRAALLAAVDWSKLGKKHLQNRANSRRAIKKHYDKRRRNGQ